MAAMKQKKKVFVAMSGGVDSSVAALLLKQKGYDVTGVFMKPWQPAGFSCLWEQDRADALRVATMLDIPFETWDFSREYERHVSRPMVESYRRGRTPNPDVECNRHIKFGLFYRRARLRGADFIATGHYARIVRCHGAYALCAATDASKDQTYFLWGMRSSQLPHVLFPVGGLLKSQVRELARSARLSTAAKKDSQGVCFVGALDMKSFLTTRVPSKKGVILHMDGRILGSHDGAGYYTIGQRHGLDITVGGGPYYVIAKDMRRNRILVGPAPALLASTVSVRGVRWFGPKPSPGAPLRAMIRYRSPKIPVHLSGTSVRFRRPVKAVASGQSIVFYRGRALVGGAIIR